MASTTITGGATARGTLHNVDAATNRLTSVTNGPPGYNFTYAYDGQGNIIQRGTQAYVFDQGNRMKSATGKATYAYDGLGHRVSVVGSDAVNRVQVYGQEGQLLYAGPTGSTGTKYVYLHNHVLAEVGAGGTTYDHTDGLGSPVAQTNASGAVLNRTRYEPYGYVAAGSTGTIGFTGHVNDNDTGLIYMQQRYYDSIAGRMLSVDPVTTDANTGDSFNRYAYVENNPYRYVDPDGRGLVDGLIKVLVRVVVAAVKTETKQVAKETAKGAAKEAAKDGVKSAAKEGSKELTKQEAKAIKTYEKNIAEHEKKLAEFKENPTVRPGMEKQSAQKIEAQQAERVEHLETEIQTFKNNIDKINGK